MVESPRLLAGLPRDFECDCAVAGSYHLTALMDTVVPAGSSQTKTVSDQIDG